MYTAPPTLPVELANVQFYIFKLNEDIDKCPPSVISFIVGIVFLVLSKLLLNIVIFERYNVPTSRYNTDPYP